MLRQQGAGRVVARTIDFLTDDFPCALLMSLNMLVEFGDAFDLTGAQFAGWCKKAGFQRCEILHLNGPASAAIAYTRAERRSLAVAWRAYRPGDRTRR